MSAQAAMADAPVRPRVRRIDTALPQSEKGKATPAMIALAKEISDSKALSYREKSAAEKKEKQLEALMVENDVPSVEAVNSAGRTVTAVLAEKDAERIDIQELYKAVPLETFLKIVTATKGNVTDLGGSTVLAKVLRTDKKPRSISVTTAKN